MPPEFSEFIRQMRPTKIKIVFGVSIFVAICLFAYFIWPTPYRYISSPLISPVGDYYKQETNVPLRFNRLTNKSDYFLRGRWISSRDLLELASLIESLQAIDRKDKWMKDLEEKRLINEKEMLSGMMRMSQKTVEEMVKIGTEHMNRSSKYYRVYVNSSLKLRMESLEKIYLWEKRY